MNRTLPLALALSTAVFTPSLFAQTAAAPAAAAPGAASASEIQKKYAPQKSKIDSESAEITSLQSQIKALPATTPDEERATRERNLDVKEKALQRDEEDASNAYQGELQEAYGKVAQKVGQTAVKYAEQNGFTLMLNVGGNQQTPSPVLWAQPSTDITQAVVNAYNTSSGIAAPPPSAPSPSSGARRTPPTGGAH